MKQYTLKEPRLMGEPDEKGIQTFWSYVEEDDRPVRFQKKREHIPMGQKILAKKVTPAVSKTDKKIPYLALEQVELLDEEPIEAEPVDDNPETDPQTGYQAMMYKLEEIHADVKTILRKDGEEGEETVVEDIGDKPINLEDIPF